MRLPRLLLAATCVAAFSQPMLAQAPAPLQSVEGPAATVSDMDAELTRSRAGLRTKVVNVDTTNSAFLFPSAGSVQAIAQSDDPRVPGQALWPRVPGLAVAA